MPFAMLRRNGRRAEAPQAWVRQAAAVVAVFLATWPFQASAIETRAREAILIDVTTGSVLFEHNADERMPTASMSKIMTMFMVFEALDSGQLSLGDELTVSEYAWRTGGSKMFVEVNDTVLVEDLIRGVIVQSGNDASIVLAEGLGGTEEAFARLMTERAHELGMAGSNFANATGWPHPDHYSTARDLATLAQAMVGTFPHHYHYYSETEFTYGVDISTGQPITQQNRNPLLYRDIGADGLKTGHTAEAGYGLTASAVQNGRRLVLVINGLESTTARAEEAVRLLEWGFREFEALPLFDAEEVIETAEVWMGSPSTLPLIAGDDLAITIRRGQTDDMVVTVRVDEPVPAPIAAGQTVATLVVSLPGMPDQEIPLVAGADIEREGFLGRVTSAAGHLIFGWLQ